MSLEPANIRNWQQGADRAVEHRQSFFWHFPSKRASPTKSTHACSIIQPSLQRTKVRCLLWMMMITSHRAPGQLSSHGESGAWLVTSPFILRRMPVRAGLKAEHEDYFLAANVVLSLLQVPAPSPLITSCRTRGYDT